MVASRPLKISKLMLNIANIAEKGLSLQLEITYRRKTMAVNRKNRGGAGAGSPVRPKSSRQQHFLTDESIAARIASTLDDFKGLPVMEVGPGMGVLTKYLIAGGHDVKWPKSTARA